MIYLYVKIHNITGLKYLGKTITYKRSGLYWSRHLKEHGNNVITYIIFQTECKETFKNISIYFSELWNIVESSE